MQLLTLTYLQQLWRKAAACARTSVHTEIYNGSFFVSLSPQSNLQTTKGNLPCSLCRLPISSTRPNITRLSRLSIETPWPIGGTRVRPRRLLCPPSCKPHPSPSSCRTAGSLAVMFHWKAGNADAGSPQIICSSRSLRARGGSRLPLSTTHILKPLNSKINEASAFLTHRNLS